VYEARARYLIVSTMRFPDVAEQLGIFVSTLYAYVNVDDRTALGIGALLQDGKGPPDAAPM